MTWISVDIDLDDVYAEMGRHEKELMVGWLREDGYISAFNTGDAESDDASPLDAEWNQMIQKIHESRYQLTPEQESVLINLYNTL